MKRIIVVGCGVFGASAAVELEKAGHQVSIVDKSYESFSRLPSSFKGKITNGDVYYHDVLVRARVDTVEAVVLTLGDDVKNITLARMFREKFNITNIIALNVKPAFRKIYDSLHISTVSINTWGILRVEEMLSTDAKRGGLSVGTSEVGVYNVVVPEIKHAITGQELMSLSQCMIFAVSQDNLTRKMSPEVEVTEGDVLHVSSSTDGLRNVYTLLGLE